VRTTICAEGTLTKIGLYSLMSQNGQKVPLFLQLRYW